MDIVTRWRGGQAAYLRDHRGATHGILALPIEAGLIAAGLRLIWPPVPYGLLFGWTLLGCLTHVLSDIGNDYGTQALWPFSSWRIALDVIPIIDVWLLGLLTAGWLSVLALPWPRQTIFAWIWLLVALYVLGRVWLRHRAWHLVTRRFGLTDACGSAMPCGKGWHEERVTIHPTLFSLVAWRYVVQVEGAYLVGLVWVGSGRVSQPARARNQLDKVVKASLKSQLVTAFSNWVRRPRAEVEWIDGMYRVRWSDMRYEVDGIAPFTAHAWLDDDLKLIDEGLGSVRLKHLDRQQIRRRLRMEMGRLPE